MHIRFEQGLELFEKNLVYIYMCVCVCVCVCARVHVLVFIFDYRSVVIS